MPANSAFLPAPRTHIRIMAAALGGVAWKLFGAIQFGRSLTPTTDSLMASGVTAEQAAAMTGHPAWLTLAFGIGVASGLLGSALLLARHRPAASVLASPLAADVALWVGDAVHGAFAAMGASPVIVLTLVVAIAGAVWAVSRVPAARS